MALAHCVLDTYGTNTHSDCVIFTAFLLQQWLYERVKMLRYFKFPLLLCNVDIIYKAYNIVIYIIIVVTVTFFVACTTLFMNNILNDLI